MEVKVLSSRSIRYWLSPAVGVELDFTSPDDPKVFTFAIGVEDRKLPHRVNLSIIEGCVQDARSRLGV